MQKLYIKDVKQKIEEYNAVVRSAADNDFFPIIYNDIDDEDHRDIFIVATYTTTVGGQLCDSGESGNILILHGWDGNIWCSEFYTYFGLEQIKFKPKILVDYSDKTPL